MLTLPLGSERPDPRGGSDPCIGGPVAYRLSQALTQRWRRKEPEDDLKLSLALMLLTVICRARRTFSKAEREARLRRSTQWRAAMREC